MNFAILCKYLRRPKLLDAAGAAERALRGWRPYHAGSRNQGLRFAGPAGSRGRVHGGSAETGDCEGDDEGADGEGLHFAYFSLAVDECLKDF
jgi:hypothetical protein